MKQKIKKITIVVICLTICIGSIKNMTTQGRQLVRAITIYNRSLGEISMLREDLMVLEEEVKYASSSAGIQRNLRQIMGLGGKNDLWIKTNIKDIDKDLYQGTPNTRAEPNWLKWWRWFTN